MRPRAKCSRHLIQCGASHRRRDDPARAEIVCESRQDFARLAQDKVHSANARRQKSSDVRDVASADRGTSRLDERGNRGEGLGVARKVDKHVDTLGAGSANSLGQGNGVAINSVSHPIGAHPLLIRGTHVGDHPRTRDDGELGGEATALFSSSQARAVEPASLASRTRTTLPGRLSSLDCPSTTGVSFPRRASHRMPSRALAFRSRMAWAAPLSIWESLT
jgi:hypothetical protein